MTGVFASVFSHAGHISKEEAKEISGLDDSSFEEVYEIPNPKHQISGCQVSGVNVEDSGVRKEKKLNTATCWSEAEIPSEAKRQRGTLKPETSVFVIWNF